MIEMEGEIRKVETRESKSYDEDHDLDYCEACY